jgi:phosphoglycerol transferase MdoB-like AlkP superfamily enzyme
MKTKKELKIIVILVIMEILRKKEQDRMEKAKNNLCWLIILVWSGFAQLYWGLAPHLASYDAASLHASAYQIIKGLTLIGPDVIVILLGYLLYQYPKKESLGLKLWLNTLVLGCLISLLVAMTSSKLNTVCSYPSTIFNSMLPIIRNSYPLITGIIGGMILSSVLIRLDKQEQWRITIAIWILIAIPIFSANNIWGWNGNYLAIFYALLFVLGGNLRVSSSRIWWLIAFGASIFNAILQGLMPYLSVGEDTVGRFTTSANVLTVLTAYAIVALIARYCRLSSFVFVASALVLFGNTSLIAGLQLVVEKYLTHSTAQTGLLTFAAIVGIFAVAGLWRLFLKTAMVRRVSWQIDGLTSLGLDQQKTALHKLFINWAPNLAVAIIAYIIAALSMLLMNNGWTIQPNVGANYNILSYTFVQREQMILLTTVLLFAAVKFLQALTKRYWLSLMLVILFNVGLIIANREKIAARNEPVLPSDMAMLKVAHSLFGMVSVGLWIAMAVAVVLMIAITIWLEKNHRVSLAFGKVGRISYLLLAPILFASCLFWNHSGMPFNNFLTTIDDEPMFYNQLSGARINGPLVQFMNNVDVKVMDQPTNYSQAEMKRIVQKYQKQAAKINMNRHNHLSQQTVIFNLSESFANPNRVPGVKLRNNPVPYITKVKKENTGGLMISSGYGGGTANMEYMTLTGFSLSNFSPTLPTPYTQLVTKLKSNPSIVDSFNYAVAIHPYLGTFYSRIAVYKKFGFNKFLYFGSKDKIKHQQRIDNSPYLSDRTSYLNVLDQLKSHSGGQFINLVTMQNHFPYTENYYHHLKRYAATRVSTGTDKNAVDEYSTEIHYTDNEVKDFIKEINRIKKPITVVFYGDHLPGIYQNSMAKDGIKLHETDYFIYSNRYARQHGAKNYQRNTAIVAPNDFIAMVAKQTNSKVNWYQALLTAVFEKLPAMAENIQSNTTNSTSSKTESDFISVQGKLVKESSLNKQQKELLHDYRLVQYDITAGKHYTLKYLK